MYVYANFTVWPYVGSFKHVSFCSECFVIINAVRVYVCMLQRLSGGSESVEH